jgi:hypothetical protein
MLLTATISPALPTEREDDAQLRLDFASHLAEHAPHKDLPTR